MMSYQKFCNMSYEIFHNMISYQTTQIMKHNINQGKSYEICHDVVSVEITYIMNLNIIHGLSGISDISHIELPNTPRHELFDGS